jgi:tetratricopeptide (TPR) repeat protein
MAPSRNATGFHPHFSPWLADSERLSRTLVGHRDLISDFLQSLHRIEAGSPASHALLVGPRGIGKTHILALIGRYVTGRLPPLQGWGTPSKNWQCALFTEEEYAGQNSLANFLLALFDKLREALPADPSWLLPPGLPQGPDQTVIDCCFERLQAFHRDGDRYVLVLIDNLQKVLQEWSPADHLKLRSFLSHNRLLVILGSAPSVFREIQGQNAAFHDFFEIRILPELTHAQMLDLVGRYFDEDGRRAEFESRRQELSRKLPAIELLTGGNPRLVLFLYEIAARSAFLDIEAALRNLLEELREYFVRRYDELPSQARKVLDTIAQMDGPATPTEIAQAARLKPTLVNAQLKRLKSGQYVRPIKLKRQKATRYDISERLFRIWRQTATVAGRQRFRFLADFLKLYFTPDEIRSLYASHEKCLHGIAGLPREEVEQESLSALDKALAAEPGNPGFWFAKAWTLAALDRSDEALGCVENARQRGAGPVNYHNNHGGLLLLAGQYTEALADFDAGLRIEPGDWSLETKRQITLGCLRRLGPLLEALPSALAGIQIPAESIPNTCDFLHTTALTCLRRAENEVCEGLFNCTLGMECWGDYEWFGKKAGNFLRQVLDINPHAFPALVGAVARRVRKEAVLKLLEPFLRAKELLETRDVGILERLFPEVRAVVLDILRRVEPRLPEELQATGRFVRASGATAD